MKMRGVKRYWCYSNLRSTLRFVIYMVYPKPEP